VVVFVFLERLNIDSFTLGVCEEIVEDEAHLVSDFLAAPSSTAFAILPDRLWSGQGVMFWIFLVLKFAVIQHDDDFLYTWQIYHEPIEVCKLTRHSGRWDPQPIQYASRKSYIFEVFAHATNALFGKPSHIAEKIHDGRNVDKIKRIDVQVDPNRFWRRRNGGLAVKNLQVGLDEAVFAFSLFTRLLTDMEDRRNSPCCKNVDLDNVSIGNIVVPFCPDDSRFHHQIPDAKSKLKWELTEAKESLGCHFLRVIRMAGKYWGLTAEVLASKCDFLYSGSQGYMFQVEDDFKFMCSLLEDSGDVMVEIIAYAASDRQSDDKTGKGNCCKVLTFPNFRRRLRSENVRDRHDLNTKLRCVHHLVFPRKLASGRMTQVARTRLKNQLSVMREPALSG
jgi:hypothetical protein